MKANWDRHDPTTGILFECESELLRGSFEEQSGKVLFNLKARFDELANNGIANSHGLDHFLQVAMAWLTTYLGKKIGQPSIRATVSRYLPDLNAILVKPCLVEPGRCRVPQPTISLKRGLNGRIGHTGVSMTLGKILYCRPHEANCDHYITLDSGSSSKTDAALCIPLEGKFEELRKKFKEEWREQVYCTSADFCAHSRETNRPDPHNSTTTQKAKNEKEEMPARWVLNIECITSALDKQRVFDEILYDDNFSDFVKTLTKLLDTYQKERSMHLALERSSTLLALATNTMKARPAYRALLREISNVCDGADVTLHLRDLFDTLPKPDETSEENEARNERNATRCSVFVTGVGENYGDFLVNERIGLEIGQIGSALTDKKPPKDAPVSRSELLIQPYGGNESEVLVQYIVGEEIAQAMKREPGAFPFKQLMPNTSLNVVVPIFFHEDKIGVINIEWDEEHLTKADPRFGNDYAFKNLHLGGRRFLENEYLRRRMNIVYRMADYLSLVIDYFDDLEHLASPYTNTLNDKKIWEQLQHDGALRQVMRYYVGQAMEKATHVPPETKSRVAEIDCLQDLVDAVGYFLASATDLRILVSVRRISESGDQLEQHVYHWLEEKSSKQRRELVIPIVDEKTVLATCAFRGVPLFGSIKKETDRDYFLYLDDNCKDLLSEPLEKVRYQQAGPDPRYEVGVPLVFGKSMLGTFDLEQFGPDQAKAPHSLTKLELCSYLQWARAIAFLIAYIEDARFGFKDSAPFKRFVLLCAQLIAEVPVVREQFMAIATHAFAEIIPVKSAAIHDKPPTFADLGKANNLAQMRFRGSGEKSLSWEVDGSAKSLLTSKTEAEPGKTVTAMMTSYHALMQKLPSPELGDDKFLEAIKKILAELARNEKELLKPSRGPADALLNVFRFLHEALKQHLKSPARESGWDDYAWFLHMRRYVPEERSQYWVCDPSEDLIDDTSSSPPEEPFAYCYTQEVRDILTALKVEMESTRDLTAALAKVLQDRAIDRNAPGFKAVLAEIMKGLAESETDEQSVIRAISAQLSRRKNDKPAGASEDEIPGFTKSVAEIGHAIVVPDINRSPNRSPRDHSWFWRYTYTVLGLPFKLDGECIAVLNVFRRRENAIDNNFFRIKERDKAQELADKVNELLAKVIAIEPYETPSDNTLDDRFAELRDSLEKLSVRQSNRKKLIVVRSPFARSAASFEVIYKHVFGERAHPELRNPVRLFGGETISGKVVVHRIPKNSKDSEELKTFGSELAETVANTKYFFLFVENPRDLDINEETVYLSVDLALVEDSLLHRSIEEEKALYSTWLMGRTMEQISPVGGWRVLARGSGDWSHDRFKNWVATHGESEQSDLHCARMHLRDCESWRCTETLFCLDTWETKSTKKESDDN